MSSAAGADAASSVVLVVEDEPSLSATLSYNLRKNGYEVLSASDGVAGLQEARRSHPDVIVLDLMLPKMDGLEVCRRIRADSDVPILMLTAKSEELDKVVGLEVGADDYLTKPFGMRELMARVRALLRRSAKSGDREGDAGHVRTGEIELDARGRTVVRAGREVALKPKEFDLVYFLATHAGQVFTREQLLEKVWGYERFVETRSVDVHVGRLRAKLGGVGQQIETVVGLGYRFVE